MDGLTYPRPPDGAQQPAALRYDNIAATADNHLCAEVALLLEDHMHRMTQHLDSWSERHELLVMKLSTILLSDVRDSSLMEDIDDSSLSEELDDDGLRPNPPVDLSKPLPCILEPGGGSAIHAAQVPSKDSLPSIFEDSGEGRSRKSRGVRAASKNSNTGRDRSSPYGSTIDRKVVDETDFSGGMGLTQSMPSVSGSKPRRTSKQSVTQNFMSYLKSSGTELFGSGTSDDNVMSAYQNGRRWQTAREFMPASTCKGIQLSEVLRVWGQFGCLTAAQYILKHIVASSGFDIFCGILIIASAALIGMETDYVAKNHGAKNETFDQLALAFNCWYVFELILRILAGGWGFFVGKDWRWSWFDLVLVGTSVMEMVASSLQLKGLVASRVVRVIRLFRVVRVLRVMRLLRYVREFRKIVFSLATSTCTLLWSLAMMMFVMFLFGVFFTQSVTDHMAQNQEETVHCELLKEAFGTLSSSMISLYMGITGGRNWGELFGMLAVVGWDTALVFLLYLSVCFFGIMNVVTSVFVDSAMQSSQHYKELLLQEKMLRNQRQVSHMKQLFKAIDEDNSGTISFEEMVTFVERDDMEIQAYFEALEISATDTLTLFTLLDHDNTGMVNIEEFCEGCMRLHGTAMSYDIHAFRSEVQREMKRHLKFQKHTMRNLKYVVGHQDFVARSIRDQNAKFHQLEDAISTLSKAEAKRSSTTVRAPTQLKAMLRDAMSAKDLHSASTTASTQSLPFLSRMSSGCSSKLESSPAKSEASTLSPEDHLQFRLKKDSGPGASIIGAPVAVPSPSEAVDIDISAERLTAGWPSED